MSALNGNKSRFQRMRQAGLRRRELSRRIQDAAAATRLAGERPADAEAGLAGEPGQAGEAPADG